MTKAEMKRKYCPGCYCNDYNYGLGGANECWSLERAEVVWRKRVHIDQSPPWNQKARQTLSCFHESRYVQVAAGQVR